jgi:alanine racemase
MGPTDEVRAAREARLELVVSQYEVPPGESAHAIPADLPVHLKLDTGMHRWGRSALPPLPPNVVGLMTHLATADTDEAFAREQLAVFAALADRHGNLVRHAANSAATLRLPEARYDAVRCGIALYGLSPFGGDPAEDGLEPVLSWVSELAQVTQIEVGESTGYGRRFVARKDTWIGIVPVGYADGFRRDMTGTEVLVADQRCPVVGAVSMDAFAVELPGRLRVGSPVTLVGRGVLLEEHARVADSLNYELATGIDSRPTRARRVVRNA